MKTDYSPFRKFLWILLFATIISGCSMAYQDDKLLDLPNIIFIMAGEMDIGDVGICNPESKIPAPNMDQRDREDIFHQYSFNRLL